MLYCSISRVVLGLYIYLLGVALIECSTAGSRKPVKLPAETQTEERKERPDKSRQDSGSEEEEGYAHGARCTVHVRSGRSAISYQLEHWPQPRPRSVHADHNLDPVQFTPAGRGGSVTVTVTGLYRL